MAEKTKTSVGIKTAKDTDRVPYTLPLTRENAENDRFHFVSLNDYTATIERGKEVMVPRYVAKYLDRQQEEEMAAFLASIGLENQFLGTV